ncbi:hypothetical protein OHA21_06795 [Actinoplanes sp. NBC_00393]|uniref:hypothetical protein n=1 Tax=Actinoplanes sp. NBC_00393 TaxID=2975953 RepID=UPI002E1D6CE0
MIAVPAEDTLPLRTSAMAEHFDVPEPAVDRYARIFDGLPAREQRQVQVIAFHAAVVNLAARHTGCPAAECPTCDDVREALAIAMAVVRTDITPSLSASRQR